MKKSSVVNLIIIMMLLVMCVMTLVGIYASVPKSESTVLMFEENFNVFDENKWEAHTLECKQNDNRSLYSKANDTNSYVQDGVLHISPASDDKFPRVKREALNNCTTCSDDSNCATSVYETRLQSKVPVDVKYGKIEIRGKLGDGGWIKSWIGIVSNNTVSEISDEYNIIEISKNNTTNGTADLRIHLGPEDNQTVVKSTITTNEYHIYTIEWKNDTMNVKIDDESILGNSTFHFNSSALQKPFYINVGVDEDGNRKRKEQKRSIIDIIKNIGKEKDENTPYTIDYIKVYEITS